MDRRFVVTSLAFASTAALAGRAFAQASSDNAMAATADNSMAMSPDNSMAAASMPMGDAEMTHAKDTATVGSLSLATSRVAVQKATNAEVKKFATFEVAEQETVSDILASMMMPPDQAQGALMVPTDAEVEAKLDAAGKTALEQLRGLSGDEFDTQYITAQTDGHQKLLEIQETYLKNGKNREHLDVAKLARGMIKEHLQHLADLKANKMM